MAQKTQEGSYTSTLPGGVPLYFKVQTTYQTDANGNPVPGSGVHTLLYNPGNGTYYPAATTKDFRNIELKKYTPEEIFTSGIAQYAQPDGTVLGATAAKSLQTYDGKLNKDMRNSVALASIKSGLTVGQAQAVQGAPQTLPNAPAPGDSQAGNSELLSDPEKSIISNSKIRSRDNYDKGTPIVYPIGLNSKYQDCIKFSVVKYQPSGLKGFGKGNEDLRRVNIDEKGNPTVDKVKETIGTIVLPIPGGIQDGNQVNWSGSEPLYDLDQALGRIVQSALTGGNPAETTKNQTQSAVEDPGTRAAIISKFTQGALGKENLMQRQYGTIINPNIELLFNSPFLRSFTFSFKLSPRSKNEAVIVKKIIRTFKQAMSVKRSESSFLLQSPHTFAISYIFQDKQHPYLNKFKECALTNCSVNYTPEGNYMSFDDPDEPSMVSYQLDLQFQELEPLYDDDYGPNYWSDIGY